MVLAEITFEVTSNFSSEKINVMQSKSFKINNPEVVFDLNLTLFDNTGI
jgi:hypothetical protein